MANSAIVNPILLAIFAWQTAIAAAEEQNSADVDDSITVLEKVVVSGDRIPEINSSFKQDITSAEINSKTAQVSDTAKLMEDTAGVSFQSNGGVSSLPIIHGLNDDRVKIVVNGMIIPSACPNHMNPTLSYIDPTNVGSISILKGVTPVSMGGDSIAGTISVQSPAPVFAEPGKDILLEGKASAFYRSNGDNYGGSIAAGVANKNARLDYSGSSTESRHYRDGNGDIVRSSDFISRNHAMGLAFNFDKQLLEIKGGQQHVPFQAYPNARMEMTANDSIWGNVHHLANFDWGNLDSKLYLENISHSMDAGPDQGAGPPPIMPMESRGRNFGYTVQADWFLGKRDHVRFGNEFHSNFLNDFWPAVCTACFDMGPNTLINLNNATRDRVGTFAEWESNWSLAWKTIIGLRYDHTMTDTGDVHGYNDLPFYAREANAFNARSHERNFDTFDMTALAQFNPNDWSQYELGYARKNRAPSLYEMYVWSTWGMVMPMIGWFGDGNAYTGNINLKAETAHNISFTAEYFDPEENAWDVKVTPYFSYVENFIDVDRCGPNAPSCRVPQPTNGFYNLQFANHSARLWGVDVSGSAQLYQDQAAGQFTARSIMSYVRGERMDGGNLYHMMPFNLKLSLDHQLEVLKNTFEMQFVNGKEDVQAIRNELRTPSYVLLNAKTSLQWKKISLNVGVDNLLDKQYYYPSGGSYIGDYYTMSVYSTPFPNNRPLAGMGRSVYVGLTITY